MGTVTLVRTKRTEMPRLDDPSVRRQLRREAEKEARKEQRRRQSFAPTRA